MTRLLETAIYGPDLETLERFYVDLLGLEPVAHTPGRNVVLRCGAAALILFDSAASGVPGGMFPPHSGPGSGHIAFSVPLYEIPAWRARLAGAGIQIEQEVTWPDGHRSLYFRDPAGNSVELAPPTLWDGLGYRTAEAVAQEPPVPTPDSFPYATHLDIKFPALSTVDVPALVRACTDRWYNQTLCQVNDAVVRLGIMQGEYHWHKHDNDDEVFFVLDGHFIIDLEERSVDLQRHEGFVVPKGIVHRTRAPDPAVILMVETASIVPTGDA